MSLLIRKAVPVRTRTRRWGRLAVVLTAVCALASPASVPMAHATRPGEEASRLMRATFQARAAGPAGYACTVLVEDSSTRILDFFEDGATRTVSAIEYGWRLVVTADLYGTQVDAEEPEVLASSGTRPMAKEANVGWGTRIDLAIAVWRGELVDCRAYDAVGTVPMAELEPTRARVFHYSHFRSATPSAVIEHGQAAAGWLHDAEMATEQKGRRVGLVMDGPDVTWTDPRGGQDGNATQRTLLYDWIDGLWQYRLTSFGAAFQNPYSPLWMIELP